MNERKSENSERRPKTRVTLVCSRGSVVANVGDFFRKTNIHGELLPEGYRFSEQDEARLDAEDFYGHKEGVELPPCNVTEADRFMAWRWYGQFFSPMRDELLRAMAWRISRERQLRTALDSLEEAQVTIAELRAERSK